MSLANSPEKKRKRASQSPVSLTRRPVNMSTRQTRASQRTATGQPPKSFEEFLKSNPALESINKEHARLVKNGVDNAWDHEAMSSASPDESRAAVIIHSLREYERRVLFGNNASEAIPGPDTLDMGGQFLTNKYRIETRSKLFQISKEVPKGALLHLHFNAELNPERLLVEARDRPNMYVWSKLPLISKANLRETELVFDVLPEHTKSNSIFSESYRGTYVDGKDTKELWKLEKKHIQTGEKCKPSERCEVCTDGYKGTYMKWSLFRKEFEKKFSDEEYRQEESEMISTGNRLGSEPQKVELRPAEYWIKQKMVLSEVEAYDPKQTVNGVWARFNQATRCFKGLLNYKTVYEWYIGAAIDRLIDEKIMYAELRPMLMDKKIPDADGLGMLNLEQQMQLITDFTQKKLKELDKATGKPKRELFPFGFKIIYCTPRSIPKTMMRNEMLDCIELKRKFKDLICGFDLVGAEDRPNHIGFYREELVAFQEACKAEDLDIPFMFHAGETLLDTGGSADPKNSNLFDAAALKSKRIGHGFSLLKHPELIKDFKDANICVELCPISNELLHLCRNIKEHPYPELLAAGIPCCVNSDNPSLFGNSMSHEFYQIMVGCPTITLHSWKKLAQWSLEYSCLNEKEVADAQKIFSKSFEHFCTWVATTYGDLVDKQGLVIEEKVEAAWGLAVDPAAEEERRVEFFKQQKAQYQDKGVQGWSFPGKA
ncbi:Metallo-dependent hydrolase [Bimuria novae-zelandiae CBS 107.79]|uniref:Metallo-dependent hydrolase n=1 Tax=Bimuria novae-zelandiae CBS 107.79 TaxID=1447943 RepID=A0A6A5V1B9_9PLEO|nr:Metallo-dependent hydrolase [Bimuria novae-zelandiae CBS 107.79]